MNDTIFKTTQNIMVHKKHYTFLLTVLMMLSFSYSFASPFNTGAQTTVKADTTILFPHLEGSLVYEGIMVDWTRLTEVIFNQYDIEFLELQHASGQLNFPFDFNTITSIDDIQITSHIHRHPGTGFNYYRLRGVVASGDYWYSDIIGIDFNVSGNIFPNPVVSQTSLYINAPAKEAATLKVYDATGRLVHSRDIELLKDFNLIGLDCSQWNPATYMVMISGEQLGNEVIKLMKQ